MPVNPGNPSQKFLPADTVYVMVANPPTVENNVNRLPNPDGAYGAYGWTTDIDGHALQTESLNADPRLLPWSERAAIGSPITGNITVVNATTIQVDPAASPTSALRYPDGMTAVDPFGKYQARIDNVPQLVVGGQPIVWNVKTTPAADAPATTPWTLEAATSGVALTPGTITPSSNAYFLNFGAYYRVEWYQNLATETDVRTIVSSARMGCVAGQRLNARVQMLGQPIRLDTGATLTTVTRQLWFNYYKADGTFISSQATAVATIAAGVTEHRLEGATAPAGAAFFTLNMRLIWPSDTAGVTLSHRFSRLLVQVGAATTVQTEEFPTFRNIFKTSAELKIGRYEMDSSNIELVTADPTYDPAVSTILRKGARAQIFMGLNGNPDFPEVMWTGAVDRISAIYPKRRGKASPLTTITFTDGNGDLANTPRSGGFASLSALPNVLEGSVVPWNVTGQTGQTGASNVPDWTNDNASALDQVAVTRDTYPGARAYLDRFGVFNVHDDGPEGTLDTYTRTWSVDESNFSATDEPVLNPDQIINTITIKAYRQINDQTEEWTYGPYEHRASIDQNGPHSATFTVGVPRGAVVGATYFDAFVAEVFARNAQPYKSYDVLPFYIDGDSNPLLFATVDLGDKLLVTSADTGFVDEPFRVSTIEHTITTKTWLLELGFTKPDGVAVPTAQPDLATASDPGWITFAKVSPAASMVDIVVEYRITGQLIEFRTSGNIAAAISVPASGDIVNQNITQSIPTELRPELGNWAWVLSVASNSAYLALTPGGTLVLFAVEGTGTAYTIAAGSALLGQSPAFLLP